MSTLRTIRVELEDGQAEGHECYCKGEGIEVKCDGAHVKLLADGVCD